MAPFDASAAHRRGLRRIALVAEMIPLAATGVVIGFFLLSSGWAAYPLDHAPPAIQYLVFFVVAPVGLIFVGAFLASLVSGAGWLVLSNYRIAIPVMFGRGFFAVWFGAALVFANNAPTWSLSALSISVALAALSVIAVALKTRSFGRDVKAETDS